MLKTVLESLKIIAKLLGLLVAIPLILFILWLGKVLLYDSIPKTRIPVASETFIRQLPGIIIWDVFMLASPQDCKEYGCKVFIPSQNETLALTPAEAEIYKQKYGNYCKSVDPNYPKSPNGQVYLNSFATAYNEQTKQTISLVTEDRSLEAIDWSPDSRYALYRLVYNDPYPGGGGQQFLYVITDLKTRKTYRILKDPEMRMDTCWVSN